MCPAAEPNPTRRRLPHRIGKIAGSLGLGPDEVEPLGWYKGKLLLGCERRRADRPRARYINVTATSPTPLGEGKTVVTIGLAMALARAGHRAIATLREPSLAPVFGIKGGGAGGGQSMLLPADDVNLHFTGDSHAVTSANNLLAAIIDNHLKRGRAPVLDPGSVTWRRVLDVSDKGLARVITGLGEQLDGPLRQTGFDLTAASEVMAILALADSLEDLRDRLRRILVGETAAGKPVFVEELGCAGAMAALLRDALRPNLVQTCEHTPAFVHAGPFGNIAHGNSSVLADRAALHLADYVVTESGFGADCGAEKFLNIKCRASGLFPDATVLVTTVRALKLHSGRHRVRPGRPLPAALLAEDVDALEAGAVNLLAHLDILRQFGPPIVVAINQFPTDGACELDLVRRLALHNGAASAVAVRSYTEGSAGAAELATAVVDACQQSVPCKLLYPLEMALDEKIRRLATSVYGAADVEILPRARSRLRRFTELGFGHLPICVAKTPYSLSHDPERFGRPTGYTFPIHDARLAAGAGYIYLLAGEISTMPGLPAEPAAYRIDVDPHGRILGLE